MSFGNRFLLASLFLGIVLTRFSHCNQVVLLDTTSVLGELGWKTYPINGRSQAADKSDPPGAYKHSVM
ncbi:hypothetical protein CgunFtcFv8_024882 [Champsocephalus gunnari]|uniref:Secreted protein n=1 Tax=Champsocephalus gunnari TaxID=52237 RepID=A0AAN8HMB2_CHAGU|nr:hypothetical protein CgunFtcFv8_024882 [Champsocephalus gunnari]